MSKTNYTIKYGVQEVRETSSTYGITTIGYLVSKCYVIGISPKKDQRDEKKSYLVVFPFANILGTNGKLNVSTPSFMERITLQENDEDNISAATRLANIFDTFEEASTYKEKKNRTIIEDYENLVHLLSGTGSDTYYQNELEKYQERKKLCDQLEAYIQAETSDMIVMPSLEIVKSLGQLDKKQKN